MDEKIKLMIDKITTLQKWTQEMVRLQENPYVGQFNLTKMLEDIGGFTYGLLQDALNLEKMISPPEETEKTSVEE